MNTRLDLLNYCVRHRLDAPVVNGLWNLAGFTMPPPSLHKHSRAGLAAVSALLIGAGLVCWVAANWSNFGRAGQFCLLEAIVLLSCAGSILPRCRTACSLLAFFSIGALFAYLGQTYQTGADRWQLFILWSALGLPLALAARSDAVWVPLIIVVMTGIGLWMHVWAASFPSELSVLTIVGCIAALCVALLLSRPLQRIIGAGPYASGVAVVAALFLTSVAALPDIIKSRPPAAPAIFLGLIMIMMIFYSRRANFDILALCACALAVNFILDTALVMLLMKIENPVAACCLIGIAACGLCGLSITAILYVVRRMLPMKGPQ